MLKTTDGGTKPTYLKGSLKTLKTTVAGERNKMCYSTCCAILNHIFYIPGLFQLIWFHSKNCMYYCHGAPQRQKHVIEAQLIFYLKVPFYILHTSRHNNSLE